MGRIGGMVLFASMAVPPAAVSAATVTVSANGDLQAAIDNARPGDVIELQPGATYTGHFTLPAKDASSSAFITIRTGGPPAVPGGARIGPAHAAALAKLRSPDGGTVLATSPGAHHWRVELVEVLATGVRRDLITLGDGSRAQAAESQIPHDLVLDRVYVHNTDPSQSLKRAIALNSASTVITGSYIVDAKDAGADSQAICGWNGPGPFTVTNNYVEAAAENILFGGADPAVPNLVPSDITITGNHFSKPTAWRSQPWVVKNVVELKNARRVTIAGNVIEYSWLSGQTGYAVLFTVRNQDGGCRWCEVRDVVFEKNLVRHAGGGIQILGTDYEHPSGLTQSVVIRNNVFADIDNQRWGGNGFAMLIIGGPRNIAIDHNTIVQEHGSGLIQVEGPPIAGFSFTNNIAWHHEYGFMGADHASGNDTIATFFPGARITNNVIAGGDPHRLPPGNRTPAPHEVCAELVSCELGDYRLKPNSVWRSAGIEHTQLGAGWTEATTKPPAGSAKLEVQSAK
jgi:Right handed beta helix region